MERASRLASSFRAARAGVRCHSEPDRRHLVQFAEIAMGRGLWAEAVSRFRLVLDVCGDETPVRAFVRMSEACVSDGRFAEARSVAARGLRLYPGRLELDCLQAEIAMAAHDWNEALRLWREVLDAHGAKAPARAHLGRAAAERLLGGAFPEPGERELNTARALGLNGRHAGETLFLFGAGPSLLSLTENQCERLRGLPTLGVNRVQYRVPLTYFVSAYPAEVLLAARTSSAQVIHTRPSYLAPIEAGILCLKRDLFDLDGGGRLPEVLEGPEPTVLTYMNVILSCLSLAAVMKPKTLVLLGLEMRNRLHFYNLDQDLTRRMIGDYIELDQSHGHLFDMDHPYCTLHAMIEELHTPVAEIKAGPFYAPLDHTRHLREYFRQLEERGTEVVSAVEDSIAVDAGARYRPLEPLLS